MSTVVAAASSPNRKRRPHSKSRRGCLECKKKHHKCDEVRPTCGSCRRMRDDCHYVDIRQDSRARSRAQKSASPYPLPAQQLHVPTSDSLSTRGTFPETPSALSGGARTPTSQVSRASDEPAVCEPTSALDLELMANVFMGGLVDVFPSHGASSTLLHKFVRLALATPYLLHEVLAVSALHLFAESKPRKELMTRASFHQTEALRLVQPSITAITEYQSHPLLFFAGFAAMSVLAEASFDAHSGCDKTLDPLDKTTHSFQLSRGTMALLAPHWPFLRQTWAWTVIRSQIEAGSDSTPSPQTIPTYPTLRSLAFGVEPDQARRACLRAVELTLGSISLVQQRKDTSLSTRVVTSWPIETDAEFHVLLAERKPVALIILAHYAALLSLGTGLWWIGKWPVLLLEHIDSRLGEEWAEFLSWPKSVVFDQPG